jgi:hypothetical protein
VKPGGPGWTAVEPEATRDAAIGGGLLQWLLGCLVVYFGLFGIGDLVLGRPLRGTVALVVALGLTGYLVGATRGVRRPEKGMI